MENGISLNCFSIPFIVIDDSKNIVSFNLDTSYNIKLLFLREPKIGQSVGDVFAQEHVLSIYGLLDECLNGNPVIVEDLLARKIVKSSTRLRVIFIPIRINVNLMYAVCLILPNLYSSNKTILSERQSRFIAHKLQAPASTLLSTADLKNHSELRSYEDLKIEEVLRNVNVQAEKINEIIINLNFLFNIREKVNVEDLPHKKLLVNHIVLVDDDPLLNMIHKILLLKYKKEALVKNFESPVKALDYIIENKPDVIFLDINMPEMNAWEFLDRFDESPSKATVFIISSSIDPNERLRAYSHKCVKEFVNKPLTYEKLTSLFY